MCPHPEVIGISPYLVPCGELLAKQFPGKRINMLGCVSMRGDITLDVIDMFYRFQQVILVSFL
jgi:hypothetical protein